MTLGGCALHATKESIPNLRRVFVVRALTDIFVLKEITFNTVCTQKYQTSLREQVLLNHGDCLWELRI